LSESTPQISQKSTVFERLPPDLPPDFQACLITGCFGNKLRMAFADEIFELKSKCV
jgi:hypothetical protein